MERPERFALMHLLVESPPLDFPVEEWERLYRLAVDSLPELIMELGRGYGNSTCVLTEAANDAGCPIVSFGFDSEHAWETRTAPRLRQHFDNGWFSPLTIVQADITEVDFRPYVERTRRAFVFWDAHGSDVAEAVLTRLLPLLPVARVVIDDMWNGDVWTAESGEPREKYHTAGPLLSSFEEVEQVWEYLATGREYGQDRRLLWFDAHAPIT